MDSIKDSIFKFLRLDNLIGHLSGYVETRIELFKLEVREEVAHAMAKFVVVIFLILFALMVLLFLSVGSAQWIGHRLQQPASGYFIVGGFYAFLFLLFMIFRKPINDAIESKVKEGMVRKKSK